ncbi:hypothetical protein RSOL_422840, partial [Rhizoctonia solani AG-3 Rhs1AP]
MVSTGVPAIPLTCRPSALRAQPTTSDNQALDEGWNDEDLWYSTDDSDSDTDDEDIVTGTILGVLDGTLELGALDVLIQVLKQSTLHYQNKTRIYHANADHYAAESKRLQKALVYERGLPQADRHRHLERQLLGAQIRHKAIQFIHRRLQNECLQLRRTLEDLEKET